jgi:outer membrane protein TolC
MQVKAQQNEQLKTFISTAFTNNSQLAQYTQSVKIAETKQSFNNSYYLPTVSLTGGYNYVDPLSKIRTVNSSGQSQELLFQPNNNYLASLGLNYQILDILKTRANVEKTKYEISIANSNVSYFKNQLAAQIATIFYSIVYLEKAVEIQDTILLTLQRNLSLAENKLLHGDALKIDVLTIKSTIASEEIRKLDIITQQDKQKSLLAYAVGSSYEEIKKNTDINFNNTLPLDSVMILKMAETSNPELSISKQKVDLLNEEWKVTKSNYLPSLTFVANAGYRNGYQPDIEETRYNYLVGFNFSYGIFQGGRLNKQKSITNQNIKQQELDYTKVKDGYIKDIDICLNEIKTNNERIENINEQIATSTEAVRITESRYKNGTATEVELFNSVSNLQKVRLNEINIRYQLSTNAIELARICGTVWW